MHIFLLHLVCRLTTALHINKLFCTASIRHFTHYVCSIVLNDCSYGTLAEWRDMQIPDQTRMQLFDPTGQERRGARVGRRIFVRTCGSLYRVPTFINLPSDLQDGDYLLVQGMGPLSATLTCHFNGYRDSDRGFCSNLS